MFHATTPFTFTQSRVHVLCALDAHPAAAHSLPEVPCLERLRDWLPEHGAAVDGGEPEGELQGIPDCFRLSDKPNLYNIQKVKLGCVNLTFGITQPIPHL